jgi:hypothetical protein
MENPFKKKEEDQQPSGQQPSEQPKKAYRYRCTEKCVFQGRFRREGEIILLQEKKEVPHFELVPEKEGA